MQFPKVRALYDYRASDTDEISLVEGEVLMLIREGRSWDCSVITLMFSCELNIVFLCQILRVGGLAEQQVDSKDSSQERTSKSFDFTLQLVSNFYGKMILYEQLFGNILNVKTRDKLHVALFTASAL